MLPETIGEDQEQLYDALGLIMQTHSRQQMQPLEDFIRQQATMLKQRTEFYKHRQLLDVLSSYSIVPRPATVHHDWMRSMRVNDTIMPRMDKAAANILQTQLWKLRDARNGML